MRPYDDRGGECGTYALLWDTEDGGSRESRPRREDITSAAKILIFRMYANKSLNILNTFSFFTILLGAIFFSTFAETAHPVIK